MEINHPLMIKIATEISAIYKNNLLMEHIQMGEVLLRHHDSFIQYCQKHNDDSLSYFRTATAAINQKLSAPLKGGWSTNARNLERYFYMAYSAGQLNVRSLESRKYLYDMGTERLILATKIFNSNNHKNKIKVKDNMLFVKHNDEWKNISEVKHKDLTELHRDIKKDAEYFKSELIKLEKDKQAYLKWNEDTKRELEARLKAELDKEKSNKAVKKRITKNKKTSA